MERTTKKIIGWSAFGLGAGAVVYAADKLGWLKSIIPGGGTPSQYVLSPTASFQPGLTTPYPLGVTAATITWQNPSTQPVSYGVQGYIVAGGSVNGHWWTSLDAAQRALQASRTGGGAALAPYVASVPNRVAVAQVGPGQQGSVKLYAQLASRESETWVFLIRPNYTGGLVATDTQGSPAGNIAQTGDSGLTAQVQVG